MNTPTKRMYFSDECKQIAVHVGARVGPTKAAELLAIGRTLFSKWKKEQPAVQAYQGPENEMVERPLEQIKNLRPCQRTNKENAAVFQVLLAAPKQKRQRTMDETAVEVEEENLNATSFAEFWRAEGGAERYLEELEALPQSQLDATVTFQLEKNVDPNLSKGARMLIEQSLEYALQIRDENKSKTTQRAWLPRKRRFLMFWHRLHLLGDLANTNANATVAGSDEVVIGEQEEEEEEVRDEIDTLGDAELSAQLDELDDDELGGDVEGGDVESGDVEGGDVEGGNEEGGSDEGGEPEGGELPNPNIDSSSPMRTVLATEANLLTWLRYDILKSDPDRGYESIMQDIKAIADLFHDQQTAGLLPPTAKNPRGGTAVRAFVKRIGKKRAEVEDKSYKDVGNTGLDNGYDQPKQLAVADHLLQKSRSQKEGWARRFDFLLSHAVCARSEDLRNMHLRGLYSYELADEKPSAQVVLALRFNKSKMNTTGRKEAGVAMRHKDVRVCPVGAAGFHFFQRWHIDGEPHPDFSARKNWYDLKLFPHKNCPTSSWGYDEQQLALKAAFKEHKVSSTKVTHTMRFVGAQWAKAAGCSEDAIRIHGRWCADRMVERYLSPVSITPIRALAGFSKNGGDVYLARDLVKPKAELQKLVFPWVPECQEQVSKLPKSATDVGAQKFLDFLAFLRRVVLQDAVLLRQQYPTLELFQNEIFKSDLFCDFATELIEAMETIQEPFCASVTRAVPLIGTALTSLQHEVQTLAVTQRQISNSQNQLTSSVAALCDQFKEADRQSSNRDAITQEEVRRIAAFCTYIGDFRQHYDRQASRQAETTPGTGQSTSHSSRNMNRVDGNPVGENEEMGGNREEDVGADAVVCEDVQGDDAMSQGNDNAIQQAPHHKMKRNVENVRDLWREWTTGIDGSPAISNLEATWGPAWRNWSKTESSHFSRRNVIWTFIKERAIELSLPCSDIVERLEQVRGANELSVHAIGDVIKGKHKKHSREILP